MVALQESNHGVYYIYDYIPKYIWESFDDEESVDISKKILDYKDMKVFAMNFFTKLLAQAIVELANAKIDENFEKLALVSIPPSKVYKKSPIKNSIDRIVKIYEKNPNEYKFNNIKKVYNCGNLLIREKNVSTSHMGKRAKYHQHILSIDCRKDFSDVADDIIFLLLDDITTTGTIMKVCEDVLIDYCINKDDIYKLAIGQTW